MGLTPKAGAGSSGLHQVLNISKVRDTTSPGALSPGQTKLAVKIISLYVQSEFTMFQLAALWSGQSPAPAQTGGWMDREQSCRTGDGGTGG